MKTTRNKIKSPKQTKVKQPAAITGNIDNIDELWGFSPKKNRGDSVEEYEKTLRNMSEFDLEKHAMEYEVSSSAPKEIVINQLLGLYRVTQKTRLEPLPEIGRELNKKLIELTRVS